MSYPKLRLLAYSLVHVRHRYPPLAKLWPLVGWATRERTSRYKMWLLERREELHVTTQQINVVVGLAEVRTNPSYLLL